MATKPLEGRLALASVHKTDLSYSKINNLTVLCETYGLFYITLVAPCWLSAQAVQEINCSLSLFMDLSYS